MTSSGSSGERIIDVELREEMRKSFIDYAMSVIVSRAIPDVRDGLKPVHRRIIFSMNETGLRPTEKYRKAATAVGDVMGKYHPHGDSAIYEALVRLAQPDSSRYLLIDGHGNFGDLDNPPAAMRYTEARLAPLSMQMLQDIDAETVDMRANFDGQREEPVVLPTRVPTLLLNGSTGIAVGMATNMAPHNLREVMDAVIAKVDDPDLTSEGLMEWIKGPDFPSGGLIMGTTGIKEAYNTGRGSVLQRGEASIEAIGGGKKMAIVITSLPYLVGPEAFTKRVADLVKLEKLTGISDVNDETDRTGLRVVIELKRDAHPEVVLNNVYKQTQLQQSFGINALSLVTKRDQRGAHVMPLTLSLAEIIQQFIDHRIDVITRRTKYHLRKAEERAHILEGLLKALENIDGVIKIIRAAQSTEEARDGLIKKFKLTEVQANAILEMQLRRLTGLEVGKIQAEYDKTQKEIAEYKKILANRQLVLDIIKKESTEIRDKFGDDRRTKIEADANVDVDLDDKKKLIPNEPMAVFITNQNYIKRISLDSFKRQKRNTRGVTGMKTREEDEIGHFFVANMHDLLLVFTNRGQVYPLEVMNLPEGGRSARGLALVNLVPVKQEEQVTAVIPVSEFKDDAFLVMLTAKAYIKKVPMSEFSNTRKSGIIAISLNEGDELGWVRNSTGKSDVIIGTSDGMCIRYSEDELRPMGRTARGVRAITLREKDTIVGCDAIEPEKESAHVLVITNDGYGKRVKLNEFRQQGRGGVGIIGTKFKNRDSKLACLIVVENTDQVVIATANGVVVRQQVADISSQGRMATGVRIQALSNDDSVVSVSKIVDPESDAAESSSASGEGSSSEPSSPGPASSSSSSSSSDAEVASTPDVDDDAERENEE